MDNFTVTLHISGETTEQGSDRVEVHVSFANENGEVMTNLGEYPDGFWRELRYVVQSFYTKYQDSKT
jgi:hypothetical protein